MLGGLLSATRESKVRGDAKLFPKLQASLQVLHHMLWAAATVSSSSDGTKSTRGSHCGGPARRFGQLFANKIRESSAALSTLIRGAQERLRTVVAAQQASAARRAKFVAMANIETKGAHVVGAGVPFRAALRKRQVSLCFPSFLPSFLACLYGFDRLAASTTN